MGESEGNTQGPGERRGRLRPQSRMRSTKDFARVYRAGSRARSRDLTVALFPNDLGHTRLGLSVGKRCWKSAVKRNRVRRVFREAFRLSQAELPEGVDLVMIASTPALVPRLEEIRSQLVAMAGKAMRRHTEAGKSDR